VGLRPDVAHGGNRVHRSELGRPHLALWWRALTLGVALFSLAVEKAGKLRLGEPWSRGVRILAKPHMSPDMIEYLVTACEETEDDIEQQVDSRPRRWVTLDSGELLLRRAA
jgi:hypothetical protein